MSRHTPTKSVSKTYDDMSLSEARSSGKDNEGLRRKSSHHLRTIQQFLALKEDDREKDRRASRSFVLADTSTDQLTPRTNILAFMNSTVTGESARRSSSILRPKHSRKRGRQSVLITPEDKLGRLSDGPFKLPRLSELIGEQSRPSHLSSPGSSQTPRTNMLDFLNAGDEQTPLERTINQSRKSSISPSSFHYPRQKISVSPIRESSTGLSNAVPRSTSKLPAKTAHRSFNLGMSENYEDSLPMQTEFGQQLSVTLLENSNDRIDSNKHVENSKRTGKASHRSFHLAVPLADSTRGEQDKDVQGGDDVDGEIQASEDRVDNHLTGDEWDNESDNETEEHQENEQEHPHNQGNQVQAGFVITSEETDIGGRNNSYSDVNEGHEQEKELVEYVEDDAGSQNFEGGSNRHGEGDGEKEVGHDVNDEFHGKVLDTNGEKNYESDNDVQGLEGEENDPDSEHLDVRSSQDNAREEIMRSSSRLEDKSNSMQHFNMNRPEGTTRAVSVSEQEFPNSNDLVENDNNPDMVSGNQRFPSVQERMSDQGSTKRKSDVDNFSKRSKASDAGTAEKLANDVYDIDLSQSFNTSRDREMSASRKQQSKGNNSRRKNRSSLMNKTPNVSGSNRNASLSGRTPSTPKPTSAKRRQSNSQSRLVTPLSALSHSRIRSSPLMSSTPVNKTRRFFHSTKIQSSMTDYLHEDQDLMQSPILSPIQTTASGSRKRRHDNDEDVGFLSIQQLQAQEDDVPSVNKSKRTSVKSLAHTAEEIDTEQGSDDAFPSFSSMATPLIDMRKRVHPSTVRQERSKNRSTIADRGRVVQPGLAKTTKKTSAATNRKPKTPDTYFLPKRTVKYFAELLSDMPLSKDAIEEIQKVSEDFWNDTLKALEAYALHAKRKEIMEEDVILLMKTLRLVTNTEDLHNKIRQHLPMELRSELIPCVYTTKGK